MQHYTACILGRLPKLRAIGRAASAAREVLPSKNGKDGKMGGNWQKGGEMGEEMGIHHKTTIEIV